MAARLSSLDATGSCGCFLDGRERKKMEKSYIRSSMSLLRLAIRLATYLIISDAGTPNSRLCHLGRTLVNIEDPLASYEIEMSATTDYPPCFSCAQWVNVTSRTRTCSHVTD
jgi:hypothetical protein